MMQLLHARCYTIRQIAREIGVSYRTALRYVGILESLGIGVEKSFDDVYFITDDKCPICKNLKQPLITAK